MTKNSGRWSVLAGLVGSGLSFACGPGSDWHADDHAPVPSPAPTTTGASLPALFAGKTERATSKVAPLAGGTLLVTSDGHAVAADPDRDQVHVVDLAKRTVVSIALQEGDEPGRVVQGPPGTAYVVARRGGAVLAVDVGAGTARRIPVCNAPRGAAYDASTSRLYVACRSGVLAVFDTASETSVARYHLDPDLRDVVVSGEQLVVSRFKAAELLVVSRDGQVLRHAQPAATAAFGGVSVTPSVAYRTLSLAGGGALVGHVQSSNTTLPSGAGAYYGATCGGSVADLSVSVVDTSGNATATVTTSSTLGGASGPLDLALSADGARVAILAAGNSWSPPNVGQRTNLWIAAPSQLSGGVFSCGSFGASGSSTATTVAGEPIAVAFDANSHWVVQSREPAQLQLEDDTIITLAADRRFDTGLAMFHMNAGGGISCGSCHPEAGEDGHVWNFSVGPRRSQTLEGGASKRAPFHWAGDLATFDDLVDEVMLKRMSLSANVDAAQRAALRDWIDSVPRTPSADDLDPAAVERGRALFQDANVACSSCHSGSDYSDHQLHDVGTGGAFITPSLVDVNVRAPLFHDGCAVELEGRFGPCGGGDQHGLTSNLSKEQRADLVQFMRSL